MVVMLLSYFLRHTSVAWRTDERMDSHMTSKIFEIFSNVWGSTISPYLAVINLNLIYVVKFRVKEMCIISCAY